MHHLYICGYDIPPTAAGCDYECNDVDVITQQPIEHPVRVTLSRQPDHTDCFEIQSLSEWLYHRAQRGLSLVHPGNPAYAFNTDQLKYILSGCSPAQRYWSPYVFAEYIRVFRTMRDFLYGFGGNAEDIAQNMIDVERIHGPRLYRRPFVYGHESKIRCQEAFYAVDSEDIIRGDDVIYTPDYWKMWENIYNIFVDLMELPPSDHKSVLGYSPYEGVSPERAARKFTKRMMRDFRRVLRPHRLWNDHGLNSIGAVRVCGYSFQYDEHASVLLLQKHIPLFRGRDGLERLFAEYMDKGARDNIEKNMYSLIYEDCYRRIVSRPPDHVLGRFPENMRQYVYAYPPSTWWKRCEHNTRRFAGCCVPYHVADIFQNYMDQASQEDAMLLMRIIAGELNELREE